MMNITDLLIEDAMILDLQATTKAGAIDEMVAKLVATGRVSDQETFKASIWEREKQTSTGLGDGIAMPHAKTTAVNEATVLFAKSKAGVDFESLDNEPTYIFFMIAAPDGATDSHLHTLASLARLLVKPAFVEQLKNVETAQEVTALFQSTENTQQNTSVEGDSNVSNSQFIVAVTACPTGIAHTFMAADSLKDKAQELGIKIRVETNGSDGVQNRLTPSEIAEADGVVIAADTNVEMARFAGKPLINRPVSDGIRKPQELIELALSPNTARYQSQADETKTTASVESPSLGSEIYKHLMNGVSNMLPFVIGGGIVIALAFMIDQAMGVPQGSLGDLGSYNPLAASFKGIGDAAFGFMLPVLAGFIASSIADRPGLAPGFVAGALAASGGAGFLGALVGGFLAGYVTQGLKKIFGNLPKSLAGIRTILFYPFFSVLITGGLMLLVNIPMEALNAGLNNFLNNLSGVNAALLGALLGGMMAVDLGGPINKAAYVFGTGTLAATVASGGSIVMASVMAGGMVPPLAIFIATLFFKNKFTHAEQQAGLTNLVMGASFITEGAIPFAAADPLRSLPSFIVGSALTGGLVSAFAIKLMAPHGGIFVILLVNQPLLYILFIVIGSIVSALMLGLLRKPVA